MHLVNACEKVFQKWTWVLSNSKARKTCIKKENYKSLPLTNTDTKFSKPNFN